MSGMVGSPPEHLGDKERLLWDALASPDVWGGILTICDRALLEQYCILAVRKAKADEEAEDNEVVMGAQGPKVNPWLTISDKCWTEMLKIADQIGGTPKSRRRMSEAPGDASTPDEETEEDSQQGEAVDLNQIVQDAMHRAGVH